MEKLHVISKGNKAARYLSEYGPAPDFDETWSKDINKAILFSKFYDVIEGEVFVSPKLPIAIKIDGDEVAIPVALKLQVVPVEG